MLWQLLFGILVIQSTAAARESSRSDRSLAGTFPFSAHHHSGGHHHSHTDDPRISRQGAEDGQGLDDNNAAPGLDDIAQAGARCVDKVFMIEEMTYDDQIHCHHSYSKKCHTTYITAFEPIQMEKCDEYFEKHCVIEYKKMAEDEEVEVCNEYLERNCDTPGPTVCETVFESECKTTHHLHDVEEDKPNCTVIMMEKCRPVTIGYTTDEQCDKWPQQVCTLEKVLSKKTTPETKCEKKPRKICGPGPCPLVQGKESRCRKVVETIVHDVPEEKCDLVPKKDCKFVTKQIPLLKPVEECTDIPKEVCVRAKVNPRRIKRPIVKKWCYTPQFQIPQTEDDNEGLEADQDNSDLDHVDNEDDTTTTPAENNDNADLTQ